MAGSHLTSDERTQFNHFNNQNLGISAIAVMMKRDRSTLYRELKRCDGTNGYCPLQSQMDAEEHKALPRKPTKDTPAMRAFVLAKLQNHGSPDSISGRQKVEFLSWSASRQAPTVDASSDGPLPASKECAIIEVPSSEPCRIGTSSIYRIVENDRKEGGDIYKFLPRAGRRYRKHLASQGRNGPGKLPVKPEQELPMRPASINLRFEPGHWEIDLMFAGDTILFTAVDRASRLAFVRAIPSKESAVVAEQMMELCLIHRVRTATTDRGLEWATLNEVVKILGLANIKVELYFCAAYHSWEKGSIENLNRLLRYFYPKGTNFEWTEQRGQEAKKVEEIMNQKPRKGLKYRTPKEVDAAWSDKEVTGMWSRLRPPLVAA